MAPMSDGGSAATIVFESGKAKQISIWRITIWVRTTTRFASDQIVGRSGRTQQSPTNPLVAESCFLFGKGSAVQLAIAKRRTTTRCLKIWLVLLGVEASKTDVQLLSKALIFELCKIVDNLSKRCEYHSTCGSPKKGGTNYSEGPSKRFNILLYRFAFRTNTEILKTDKLQNVQYLKGDASTEGDECVTSY